MEQKLKIAVFIDFDNIEIGVKSTLHREFDVAAVLDTLKERGGEIVTKFAYANWGRHRCFGFLWGKGCLFCHCRPAQQPCK